MENPSYEKTKSDLSAEKKYEELQIEAGMESEKKFEKIELDTPSYSTGIK